MENNHCALFLWLCKISPQVLAFVDGEEDLPAKVWDKKHKEDILAVDFYDPAEDDDHQADPCIVATSSYDGDIIIWEMETGHMLYRLNAHEGMCL